jgi:hypothetical protein
MLNSQNKRTSGNVPTHFRYCLIHSSTLRFYKRQRAVLSMRKTRKRIDSCGEGSLPTQKRRPLLCASSAWCGREEGSLRNDYAMFLECYENSVSWRLARRKNKHRKERRQIQGLIDSLSFTSAFGRFLDECILCHVCCTHGLVTFKHTTQNWTRKLKAKTTAVEVDLRS